MKCAVTQPYVFPCSAYTHVSLLSVLLGIKIMALEIVIFLKTKPPFKTLLRSVHL